MESQRSGQGRRSDKNNTRASVRARDSSPIPRAHELAASSIRRPHSSSSGRDSVSSREQLLDRREKELELRERELDLEEREMKVRLREAKLELQTRTLEVDRAHQVAHNSSTPAATEVTVSVPEQVPSQRPQTSPKEEVEAVAPHVGVEEPQSVCGERLVSTAKQVETEAPTRDVVLRIPIPSAWWIFLFYFCCLDPSSLLFTIFIIIQIFLESEGSYLSSWTRIAHHEFSTDPSSDFSFREKEGCSNE